MYMVVLTPLALLFWGASILYFRFVLPKEKDERMDIIFKAAYKNAYSLLLIGIAFLFLLTKFSAMNVDLENFKNYILIILLISSVAYVSTVVYLNKKM